MDPLEDAIAGVAALLNEQVRDGDPNMLIQQLGSGVHHPDEQKEGDHCAPLPESRENHHLKVKVHPKSPKGDQMQESS